MADSQWELAIVLLAAISVFFLVWHVVAQLLKLGQLKDHRSRGMKAKDDLQREIQAERRKYALRFVAYDLCGIHCPDLPALFLPPTDSEKPAL
jgi:hypothetical protein